MTKQIGETAVLLTIAVLASVAAAISTTPRLVSLTVAEESPANHVIGSLKSRFSLPDGSRFLASYPTEEIRELFPVNRDTGEVATGRRRIDRETLCPGAKRTSCERAFNVEVKQAGSNVEELFTVHVTITDINDQRPRFRQASRPFVLSIAESDQPPVRFSLPIAEDADSDRHDAVAYRLLCKEDAASRHFKLVTEDRSGRRVPMLELIRQLDREVKDTYELELLAGDAEYPEDGERLEILVRVLDANDNRPVWRLASSRLVVSECGPLHRPLLQLAATDADEDKRIRYRIAGTASPEVAGSFYISGDQLMQNRSLDYETVRQRALYLPLLAEDSGGLKTEAEIEIRVTDCNDHYPNISVQLIDGKPAVVVENDQAEALLARVIVRDEDEGENGSVSCRVADAQRHQFELQQLLADGPHVSYKLRKVPGVAFDRESAATRDNRWIGVEIVCRDGATPPKERRSEVRVEILDENDNSPVPERVLHEFRVLENQPPGTLVGRLRAADNDAGENARLTYRLGDSVGQQFFALQPVVGSEPNSANLVTLVSLDREQRDQFDFVVVVSDNGKTVQQSATISVKVIVLDEDDSSPVFVHKEYSFSLPEDYGRNSSERFVGQVEATDADLGGNARIRYEVGSSGNGGTLGANFFFRNNRLYARGNLDRERRELISLELRAVGVTDPRRSGSAHATIALLDVNDNPPQLVGLSSWCNLSAASPAGTQVTQLRAVDPDAGRNGSLAFSLVGSDHGHFSIDPVHGIVTLVKALARTGAESPPAVEVFRLVARVTDRGQPPLSSRAESVYIRVVDLPTGRIAAGGGSGVARDGGGGALQGAGRRSPHGNGSDGVGGPGMEAEQHVLILLCLAGVVFLIFVLLLGVLVYVHLRGRQQDAAAPTSASAWYEKDHTDTADDQTEAAMLRCQPDILKSATIGRGQQQQQQHKQQNPEAPTSYYHSATMAIDNSRQGANRTRGSLVRFPSIGYLQASAAAAAAAEVTTAADPTAGSYAPVYGKNYSERLPRKVYASTAGASPENLQQQQQAAEADRPSGKTLPKAQAEAHQRRGFDPQGYAMLTDAASSPPSSGAAVAVATVCKTPYMTSSFV